jgi:hypothetical protein
VIPMRITSNPEHRQNHTGTSASTNVPITARTTPLMNRKAPPAPPSPPHHHHSHFISTDSSMGDMGDIVSMSTKERVTMKFNKRPGTVKLIPTTTPVTCVEDLQKILLPTKLNNLGKASASASLLAFSPSSSSASKMKSTGGTGYRPPTTSRSSNSTDLRRQNFTQCCVDYVPDQQDVIIFQQEHSRQHQASPMFQRSLQQYVTAYRERSTVVQRRKAALQVMRAVQARGGNFLCSLNQHQQHSQQWAVVSNITAERFIARLLEQVARNKQPAVSKMARAAQIVSQHRAPMKKNSRSASAANQAAVHVLLHRHPVAPPRPTIKLVNKETLKNKKLALIKAVTILTKPVLQQQQPQKRAPAPPKQFQKKQRRSSSVLMKPPFARPPIERKAYVSYPDQQQQASAAGLEPYTTRADLDEAPRRVSWDKATIEAQRRAQHQVQMQHQGYQVHQQGQARKVSSVFNALDLLSSAAILDGGSSTSRSNSMSSSGSSDSDSDEHSSEESLSLLHATATSATPQQQHQHQEQTGSLLKQRREQFHRLNSSSVVPVVNNYDDAHIKADLSYIWK